VIRKIELKEKTNAGEFGEPIELLQSIKVNCEALGKSSIIDRPATDNECEQYKMKNQ
jgi:hypothetical protein